MIPEQDIFKPSFDRNPVTVSLALEKVSLTKGMRGFANLCGIHDSSPLSKSANNEHVEAQILKAIMRLVRPALFSPPNVNESTFVELSGNRYATMIVSPEKAVSCLDPFRNNDFQNVFLTSDFPKKDGKSHLFHSILCTCEEDEETGEWKGVEEVLAIDNNALEEFGFHSFDIRLTVPNPATLEKEIRKIRVSGTLLSPERLLNDAEVEWIVDAYTWFHYGYADHPAYLQIGGNMDPDLWIEDEGLDKSCLIACAKTDGGGDGVQYLYIKDGQYKLFTEMG
jgi:hypothetical protein